MLTRLDTIIDRSARKKLAATRSVLITFLTANGVVCTHEITLRAVGVLLAVFTRRDNNRDDEEKEAAGEDEEEGVEEEEGWEKTHWSIMPKTRKKDERR